jgi:hypothetical protein
VTAASSLAFVRRHALFLGLLACGAALRLEVALAYKPVLIIDDSQGFLANADHLRPDELHPMGYPLFLWLLHTSDGLDRVALAQHAVGLAIALLIYVLLARLGVPRWASALAVAPVPLDAYQLDIEQFLLAETLFEALLVATCAALLWRRRPGVVEAGIAGLLCAATALTRPNGMVVIAPALLALIFLRWRGIREMRSVLPAAAALLAAFALPLAGYAIWFHSLHGTYAITGNGGRFLYGRVMPFAECAELSLPVDERVLCPAAPVGDRPTLAGSTSEYFQWGGQSPIWLIDPDSRSRLAGDFARRVIRHQPLDYLRAVAHDFRRGFALTRTSRPGELWISRWQFPETYPVYLKDTAAIIRAHGGGRAHVDRGRARALRDYQRFGFTPGPVLIVGLVAGVLAALGVGRARGSGLRSASFLFVAMAFAVFASSVMVNQFSWRYQLSLVVLLPPAAAVGLTALLSAEPARRRARAASAPLRPGRPAAARLRLAGPGSSASGTESSIDRSARRNAGRSR